LLRVSLCLILVYTGQCVEYRVTLEREDGDGHDEFFIQVDEHEHDEIGFEEETGDKSADNSDNVSEEHAQAKVKTELKTKEPCEDIKNISSEDDSELENKTKSGDYKMNDPPTDSPKLASTGPGSDYEFENIFSVKNLKPKEKFSRR